MQLRGVASWRWPCRETTVSKEFSPGPWEGGGDKGMSGGSIWKEFQTPQGGRGITVLSLSGVQAWPPS